MAANVDTLNSRVPTNCTDVAHQSIRQGAQPRIRHDPGWRGSWPSSSGAWAAPTASRNCRNAADVKKIDPTK